MGFLCGVYWKGTEPDGLLLIRKPLELEAVMDKNGLSAFLLGLGVGVGLGMLFAPKSGQETRELIKNKAGEGGIS